MQARFQFAVAGVYQFLDVTDNFGKSCERHSSMLLPELTSFLMSLRVSVNQASVNPIYSSYCRSSNMLHHHFESTLHTKQYVRVLNGAEAIYQGFGDRYKHASGVRMHSLLFM